MNVIVTGGAGFIGSHLCELLLKKKNNITVIDNFSTGRFQNLSFDVKKKIKIIKADISKKGVWQKSFLNANYVFHLASLADVVPSINNPSKYFDSNVLGTINVLESCRGTKIKKIVYAASSSCYGIPKDYPTKETSPLDTKYPYALTKKIGEDLLMHWGMIYKLPVISLRLFNVYGTKSRTSGTYGAVFGVFIAQKLSNKPFTIVGDGKQKRDFTYVTDVILAMYLASKSKYVNEIFNVGSGKSTSINQIAKLLKGKKVFIPKRPGEPEVTHANISKIKRLLNWKPTISIEKGTKLLLKDIKYWENAPVWTVNKIKTATKDWFKFLG